MIQIIPTPERWPSKTEDVKTGLYETTLGKASTLLRRGVSLGFRSLHPSGPQAVDKTHIYSIDHPDVPCILGVERGERTVHRYDPVLRSRGRVPQLVLHLTFWSVGNTGVAARHIKKVKDGVTADDLHDPFEAALLGRFVTLDQLQAAFNRKAA